MTWTPNCRPASPMSCGSPGAATTTPPRRSASASCGQSNNQNRAPLRGLLLFFRARRLPQLLDAALDAFGQLALGLERPERRLRLLHLFGEPVEVVHHVIDDGLLLPEGLEVQADVFEHVGDDVGLELHLV